METTWMGLEPTTSAVTGRRSKPTELPGHLRVACPFSDRRLYYYSRFERKSQAFFYCTLEFGYINIAAMQLHMIIVRFNQ